MGGSESQTRVTLLGRLRRDPTDQAAWAEFVDHYGGKIFGWCRRVWNLQEADARDVTQTVLLKLATRMRDFDYDPSRSFRAWLKTVAQHAWSDFREAQRRAGQASGDRQLQQLLDDTAAPEGLVKHLEDEFDRELLEEAMTRIRLRVAPQTWEAFRLTAQEQLSGAEVSQRIGMQVSQVFVAKHRVQKLLQEEVRRLEQDLEPS